MITFSLRTPLIELRSVLAIAGLRTREEYDELVYSSEDCEFRLCLRGEDKGQIVRCFISMPEERMLTSGLELFNEVSLEGHPIVAYGAGRGQVTFEFEWFHSTGVPWRASGVRVESLMQRLTCVLGPKPAPMRARAGRRKEGVPAFMPRVFAAA